MTKFHNSQYRLFAYINPRAKKTFAQLYEENCKYESLLKTLDIRSICFCAEERGGKEATISISRNVDIRYDRYNNEVIRIWRTE